MGSQDIAELLSLVLTAPTIVFGIGVCVHWGKDAIAALSIAGRDRTAADWLILGIFIGFLGAVCDNSYWGLAWTSSYVEHDAKDVLFNNGVYFNIPFRQMAGIYSAYCHLRSYAKHKSGFESGIRVYGFLSLTLGAIYVSSLFLVRQ